MSKFGKNIKKIRNVRGLTQVQLAEMLDVSRGVISSYEEGRAEPKIETILKTAEVFNLTTDALLKSNLTVNQLSGFALPSVIQEPTNRTSISKIYRDFSELFPENLTIILSKDVPFSNYIQEGASVFAIPAAPSIGKLCIVESNGKFKIGKITELANGNVMLDDQNVTINDSKGIFEIIGTYSPLRDMTPLEERLTKIEQRLRLLEHEQKANKIGIDETSE